MGRTDVLNFRSTSFVEGDAKSTGLVLRRSSVTCSLPRFSEWRRCPEALAEYYRRSGAPAEGVKGAQRGHTEDHPIEPTRTYEVGSVWSMCMSATAHTGRKNAPQKRVNCRPAPSAGKPCNTGLLAPDRH